MASQERLLSCPWAPVDIGGSRFLCKSWFGATQYHVLLMDSDCLWEEQLQAAQIQTRAQELNRRLRASIDSLFSHLVAVVTPCLTGSGRGPDQVTVLRRDGDMTLRLKSELAGLPFYWEFHCRPAPVTTACEQLVRPLLVMSGALRRQREQLFVLLRSKDAEIQDFRENGAQLTRERLQTEPFEEDTFRQSFLSQTLPSLLDEHEASLSLDPELQELYSAVTSPQNARNKRKRHDSEDRDSRRDEAPPTDATPAQNHRSGDESEAPSLKETDKAQTSDVTKTTLPTMQQSVASYPSAADRAAPKPKKKKTGLFR